LNVRASGILSLCAVILTTAVLSIPVAGVLGIVGDTGAAEEEETVLRIGFMQTIDSLNPMIGLSDAAYVFYGLVYDALHSVGNDFETVGNLATNWMAVPETDPELQASGEPYGSVWEFDITHNAKWHNGELLSADDIVYTVNLNCQNYEAMWAYQPYAYFMKRADKVDEDTVRIHFYDRDTGESIPSAYAGLVCIPMLPAHMLQQLNAYDIAFNWSGVFEDSPPIVGSGPFMATDRIYQDWLDGDYVTLLKNPEYHWAIDKGLEIQFDKLMLYFYDEATAMRLALERGELDIAQFPPHEYRTIEDEIESGELKNITAFAGLKCTQYWTEIGINQATGGPNPSRLDPAIRHAMAMATNKDYIIDNYYFGYADEGTTLISPVNTQWHYEPTSAELFPYDLAAADALLNASGYLDVDEDGIRECTDASLAVIEGWVSEGTKLVYDMLIRREFPEERDIAMYLDQEWRKIGIDISYRVMSEASLSTIAYSYAYDTLIWYWSADPDPNFMLFCQSRVSYNGWSDNYYTNPLYEENYSASVSELNEAQRKIYTDNCQRISYEDAAYIILAYPYQTYAWRTDTFEGWGDWQNDPCRSVDAFWTGNPLYFDLVPTGIKPPNGEPPWLLIAIAAGVVVAVVAAVVVATKMRKKGGEGESSLGD